MELAQFAKDSIGQDGTGCGIVYSHTRADTETLAHELCKRGVHTKAYHAGLEVVGSY
jgi:superfamily II DNA helicase RecQ